MKIYWFKAQAPRRVVGLAKYLGIQADFVEIDLVAGDLQAAGYGVLNPNRKVPLLVDGDEVVWESSAIMAYLCIKAGSDLWPAHRPAEQVEVLRWLSWNDGHWSPAVAPFYFEQVVKATFGFGPPDRALLQASVADILKYARVLEGHLVDRPYVACGRLTIADFQLSSMATYWRESEMPLGEFPYLVRWLDRLMCIPAWADPWPVASAPWESAES